MGVKVARRREVWDSRKGVGKGLIFGCGEIRYVKGGNGKKKGEIIWKDVSLIVNGLVCLMLMNG